MEILESLAELARATAKKMELKNQQTEQFFRCQSCQLPYICLEDVIAPVFSSFFGRKFVPEELCWGCNSCILAVALPEPLSEDDRFVLQRKLERRLCKILGRSFAEIVRAKLVKVTCECVYIRM